MDVDADIPADDDDELQVMDNLDETIREPPVRRPKVAEFRFPIFRKRRSVRPRERGKSSAMPRKRRRLIFSTCIALSRLRGLQEMKDLVLGGGSTGYAAMDRIILEGARKYHYSNHPTYPTFFIPSVAQHWDRQLDIAPYPIIRPSCYYDSKRRYDGDEMRQIVELSRSYMQHYRGKTSSLD